MKKTTRPGSPRRTQKRNGSPRAHTVSPPGAISCQLFAYTVAVVPGARVAAGVAVGVAVCARVAAGVGVAGRTDSGLKVGTRGGRRNVGEGDGLGAAVHARSSSATRTATSAVSGARVTGEGTSEA
jgi:hypothetical protein